MALEIIIIVLQMRKDGVDCLLNLYDLPTYVLNGVTYYFYGGLGWVTKERLAQSDIEKIEEIKEGLFTNKDVPKCEICPYNMGLNSGQKFPCGLQKCYISMFYNSYSEKLRSSS